MVVQGIGEPIGSTDKDTLQSLNLNLLELMEKYWAEEAKKMPS